MFPVGLCKAYNIIMWLCCRRTRVASQHPNWDHQSFHHHCMFGDFCRELLGQQAPDAQRASPGSTQVKYCSELQRGLVHLLAIEDIIKHATASYWVTSIVAGCNLAMFISTNLDFVILRTVTSEYKQYRFSKQPWILAKKDKERWCSLLDSVEVFLSHLTFVSTDFSQSSSLNSSKNMYYLLQHTFFLVCQWVQGWSKEIIVNFNQIIIYKWVFARLRLVWTPNSSLCFQRRSSVAGSLLAASVDLQSIHYPSYLPSKDFQRVVAYSEQA